MSLHKKMQAVADAAKLRERDRVMRILHQLVMQAESGLNKKLMTAGEKHLAQVKMRIVSAVVGAIQIKVMSGVEPSAEDTPQKTNGSDPDALGGTQGNPPQAS